MNKMSGRVSCAAAKCGNTSAVTTSIRYRPLISCSARSYEVPGEMPVRGVVRVGFVVLPQQILAVVVAVRCAHDAVNVIARGDVARTGERGRALMIELDVDDGVVDAVVEDVVGARVLFPCEVRC